MFALRLRRTFLVGLGCALVLLVGCQRGPTASPVSSTVVTAAPTTTTPPTTTSSTSTTTTTSLPQPLDPPPDPEGFEPEIVLGSIAIPKIDVEMDMYEGIRMVTLNRGPGHWPGSAFPGQAGNMVIGGHRMSHHRVFRNVHKLEPGDEIVFEYGDATHIYRVTRLEVVSPEDLWVIDPTPEATVTLFACHPPGSTRQRLIVFGELVD